MKLTQKQETFTQFLFTGINQREAYQKAGYACNSSLVVIDSNASRLANSEKVLARLAELNTKAESASVMSVLERKQRLTEIARANLTQFMELGKDGSWVNLGPETPNPGAIQEIHSRTEYDKDTDTNTVYTSVKLHDPIRAIQELNKMEGNYAPVKTDLTSGGEPLKITPIYQIINIETQNVLTRIQNGERTDVEANNNLPTERGGLFKSTDKACGQ